MYRTSLLVAVIFLSTCNSGFAQQASEPIAWKDKAFEYATQIEAEKSRDHAFYQLARRYAKANKFATAKQCADKVASVQKKVYSLASIANQAKEQNENEIVFRAVNQACDVARNGNNLHAHSKVVELLLASDRVDDSISFAVGLKTNTHKHYIINLIAEYLVKKDNLDWAIDTVEMNIGGASREVSYSQIAVACAESGDIKGANNTMMKISNPVHLDHPLATLALHYAKESQFTKAQKLAGQMTDKQKQSRTLAGIAELQADSLSDETLLEKFEQENDIEAKSKLAEKIVKRLLEKDEFQEANDWIQKAIDVVKANPREPVVSKFGNVDDASRMASLQMLHLDIAKAYHEKSDEEKAMSHLEIAQQAVADLNDSAGLGKVFMQQKLLQTIHQLNLSHRFPNVAQKTEVGFMKPMATAEKCASLVEEGNIEKAFTLALELEVKTSGPSLGNLLKALVNNDHENLAIDLINQWGDSDNVGYACEAFGAAIAKAEKLDSVQAILSQLNSNAARAHTCLGIADSIPQTR